MKRKMVILKWIGAVMAVGALAVGSPPNYAVPWQWNVLEILAVAGGFSVMIIASESIRSDQ